MVVQAKRSVLRVCMLALTLELIATFGLGIWHALSKSRLKVSAKDISATSHEMSTSESMSRYGNCFISYIRPILSYLTKFIESATVSSQTQRTQRNHQAVLLRKDLTHASQSACVNVALHKISTQRTHRKQSACVKLYAYAFACMALDACVAWKFYATQRA